MTCEQTLDRFGDFVDDELARRERIGVRLHLLICTHCRRYFASYRTTIRAEKQAFSTEQEAPDANTISDNRVKAILKAALGDRA